MFPDRIVLDECIGDFALIEIADDENCVWHPSW